MRPYVGLSEDDRLEDSGLMLTPSNTEKELEALWEALGKIPFPAISISPEYNASSTKDSILPQAKGRQMLSIRQALFAPHEVISVEESLGRICGTPTVSCPPAIPIAVSGEEISEEAIQLFRHYGVTQVDVVI